MQFLTHSSTAAIIVDTSFNLFVKLCLNEPVIFMNSFCQSDIQ